MHYFCDKTAIIITMFLQTKGNDNMEYKYLVKQLRDKLIII